MPVFRRKDHLNLKQWKWDEATSALPGEFEKLPAGAYVCRIVDAYAGSYDDSDKTILFINIDIAEGDYAGTFKKKHDQFGGEWPFAAVVRFYMDDYVDSGKAGTAVKKFINGLEHDNNFKVKENFDPRVLIGKLCAFTFREEEYKKNDGSVQTSVKAYQAQLVEKVRAGQVKTPALKKLKEEKKPEPAPEYDNLVGDEVDDADLPF